MLFIYYDLTCETVHLVTSIDTWIVWSIPLIEKKCKKYIHVALGTTQNIYSVVYR